VVGAAEVAAVLPLDPEALLEPSSEVQAVSTALRARVTGQRVRFTVVCSLSGVS